MRVKDKQENSTFAIYIFLFDMCILPTFHIAGLPFKVAYLISFLMVFLYLVNANIRISSRIIVANTNFKSMRSNPQARRMLLCVAAIILITMLGEMTCYFYTTIVDSSPLRNAIFFYIVLLGSMIIGYCQYNYNKNYLIFLLVLYCGINIIFSILGTGAPLFLRRLYNMIGEKENFYFSLRMVGTMGNPNATLCVMNMLFMSIVVYVRRGEIKVDSLPKLSVIVVLPLFTNGFVNSRGEFLVTLVIMIGLFFAIMDNNENISKTILRIGIIIAVGLIAFYFLLNYLLAKYPTVAYSINRLSSIFSVGTNTTVETDSLSDRPFIHFDEFVDRFKTSPIWGTGFGKGNTYPFLRSCESFHNDWFRIFGSGGILGGCVWLYMIYISIKKC